MSTVLHILDLPPERETSLAKIERHLVDILQRLRWRARGNDPLAFETTQDAEAWSDEMDACRPTAADRDRIRRRARELARRREAASGMMHLDPEAQARLRGLAAGVRAVRIATEHQADEIAAALHDEMPWMAEATTIVWQAMRESLRAGAPALRLPPLLLDGSPGVGKSHWARRLAALIGAPSELIDAAAEPAGFAVAGTQRGWASAQPGRPVELIMRERIGNPIIVIDEIDKVGEVRSDRGTRFALADALLPLLEPLSAQRWSCPYFRVSFDMSWIGWVLTSNDLRRVPAPLVSRCRVVEVPPLAGPHLAGFARRQGAVRGLSEEATEVLAERLQRGAAPLDLRAVLRLIDGLAAREHRPQLH